MRLDRVGLERVLTALGEQLAAQTDESFALVVCGGSALQALGLVQRTTRDVDVLALLRADDFGDPLLVTAEPLPPLLLEASRIVGEDFKLPKDWLNNGPTDLLREGLPEGCAQRLHTFSYGKSLKVHFLDRIDLPQDLRRDQWRDRPASGRLACPQPYRGRDGDGSKLDANPGRRRFLPRARA